MNNTILFADDDEDFFRIGLKFLKQAGFDVIEAHDGEEAFMLATKEKPLVLILDVAMPKKDGLTVMKEVRQTPWGESLPIFILTAKDPDDARLKEIIDWMPTYYFVKGNEKFEDIISKIQEVISEHKP